MIIKTDNPGAAPKTCTVTCRFALARFSCTQNIPAGARNWFVCVRPTRGKNLGALQGGQRDLPLAYTPATTRLRNTPMPVISISTVSPGFMFCGSPSVPIHITSPGSMVQYFDTSAM